MRPTRLRPNSTPTASSMYKYVQHVLVSRRALVSGSISAVLLPLNVVRRSGGAWPPVGGETWVVAGYPFQHCTGTW